MISMHFIRIKLISARFGFFLYMGSMFNCSLNAVPMILNPSLSLISVLTTDIRHYRLTLYLKRVLIVIIIGVTYGDVILFYMKFVFRTVGVQFMVSSNVDFGYLLMQIKIIYAYATILNTTTVLCSISGSIFYLCYFLLNL